MKVLVDTAIWSLALRRRRDQISDLEQHLVAEWRHLVDEGDVVMIGPIRQELLSGMRTQALFDRLSQALRAFPDEVFGTDDYEGAARLSNRCREAGVAVSSVDAVICAAAINRRAAVFTTDRDFERYAALAPLVLHRLRA